MSENRIIDISLGTKCEYSSSYIRTFTYTIYDIWYLIFTIFPNDHLIVIKCIFDSVLLGGFFLNNESIPVYFIWIKYISWLNYSNEIVQLNQWNGVKNITCDLNSNSCFRTGEEVLEFSGVKEVFLVTFKLLNFLK